ncbi:MAG: ATP-binding protein [Frankiaceae bacterium]
MSQVLDNLIGNAVKFTSTGRIVVRVAGPDAVGTRTVVRFEVGDTGDGIAPEKLATIFQPFIQADTSSSRKYGGTGLGLAISDQLVSLMGGHCGVSSQLGAGSNFWFTISVQAGPRCTGGPPAARSSCARIRTGGQPIGNLRSLRYSMRRQPRPTDECC